MSLLLLALACATTESVQVHLALSVPDFETLDALHAQLKSPGKPGGVDTQASLMQMMHLPCNKVDTTDANGATNA